MQAAIHEANNIINQTKERKLWELLYENHKRDSLIEMGGELGVKMMTSWNKKTLAQSIEKYVTADPSHLTFRMPFKEIQDLRLILRAGGVMSEGDFEDADSLRFPNLYFRHFIELVTEDSEEYWIVPDNLREALLPIANELDNEQELRQWDLKEKFVCGLIYLYGIVSLEKFVTIYNELNGEDALEASNLTDFIEQRDKVSNELYIFIFDDTEYVVSSRMENMVDIMTELVQRPELEYHSFTKEEVLEVGTYYSLSSLPSKKLFNYLTGSLDMPESLVLLLMRSVWEMAQNNTPIPELIKTLIKDIDEAVDKDWNADKFLSLLRRYVNSLPRWILKGNSPNEVFDRDNYLRIFPQIVEDADEINEMNKKPHLPLATPYKDISKIGYNDPCPCGSGKKYKKCCGNN
ncbi:hypothetical protein EZS27_019984 [termite gut metagenome]|uniref:Protein translocase subunit SecA n=1 Tax=termite gut metagenome TaxID=433724 RepID=A0A5J4RET9_9ZZZZ